MEKRMFFFSPIGVHRKQGAEVLGLGLAGLAGSAMSAFSADSNNRQALAFNKWSQLQSQEYQTQMYNQQRLDQENFYKKYQSPQAIAQALSQLGVSPAVALSGGHGVGAAPAAMPSGMSSSALSAPALENTGEHWAKGLTNITSSIAQLSQASKSNVEAQQILQTMPHVVRQYLLDNQNKEIANAYDGLMLSIQEKYGDSKAAQDLVESISRTVVNWSQGNLNEAAAELQKIQKKIADKEFDMKEIEAANFQTQISYLLKKMKLENDYINEQINTEKTQQGFNRAAAFNQRSQGSMVQSQKVMQDFYNRIYNNKEMAKALFDSIIQAAKHAGNQNRIDNQQVKLIEQKVEAARKANNYYELQFWLGQAHELLRDGAVVAGELNRNSMLGRFMQQGSTTGFNPQAGQGYTIDQNGGLSRVYDANGKPLIFR